MSGTLENLRDFEFKYLYLKSFREFVLPMDYDHNDDDEEIGLPNDPPQEQPSQHSLDIESCKTMPNPLSKIQNIIAFSDEPPLPTPPPEKQPSLHSLNEESCNAMPHLVNKLQNVIAFDDEPPLPATTPPPNPTPSPESSPSSTILTHPPNPNSNSSPNPNQLNLQYNEMARAYELAINKRFVTWTARYTSVKQGAYVAISLFLVFMSLSVIYYTQSAEDLSILDSIYFVMQMMTTVGYGNFAPTSQRGRLLTTFLVLFGVVITTILGAEIYQYLAVVAARTSFARDHDQTLRTAESLERLSTTNQNPTSTSAPTPTRNLNFNIFSQFSRFRTWTKQTKLGHVFDVLFPLLLLVILGGSIVGPLEGWSAIGE